MNSGDDAIIMASREIAEKLKSKTSSKNREDITFVILFFGIIQDRISIFCPLIAHRKLHTSTFDIMIWYLGIGLHLFD